MRKVNSVDDLSITASTWLDTHFIHTYLKNKYKKNANILVVPTVGIDSVENLYRDTHFALTQDESDILTDVIIPFHMHPSQHFTLLHVKYVGNEKRPVISWLDSVGGSMPAAVKATVNKLFTQADKTINEQAITAQQTNGNDCGVYVARNADACVNNTGNFSTMTPVESVQLRKNMVEVVNTDSDKHYIFVENQAHEVAVNASAIEQNAWDESQFIDTISQDLLNFGASIADKANAYETFDQAFDLAAAAYQKAAASPAGNKYAFFNEYNSAKAKLQQHKASPKTCAQQEAELLQEGTDFFRVPHDRAQVV
ncbi:MAG: Ulp1 family isopeptidase [Pseudomonadota bacterium]|nr:Ulp1 family isopeptidase [Pseudomonadota bacterium]